MGYYAANKASRGFPLAQVVHVHDSARSLTVSRKFQVGFHDNPEDLLNSACPYLKSLGVTIPTAAAQFMLGEAS